eukprot:CAMPEP_0115173470 /NCGR_PEP_ID=MMETSP0270-20121206/3342_1 /TAXON_ID=71861 /ORGANISM="Scrippsiella trochoidea, Strain CCMP3099" /LENGTH=154 /DNA_ID=CAMNT_0002586283 /DNA_START=819 /DNA_END=1280 /DNA_ORIENTATION=-
MLHDVRWVVSIICSLLALAVSVRLGSRVVLASDILTWCSACLHLGYEFLELIWKRRHFTWTPEGLYCSDSPSWSFFLMWAAFTSAGLVYATMLYQGVWARSQDYSPAARQPPWQDRACEAPSSEVEDEEESSSSGGDDDDDGEASSASSPIREE